MSNPLKWILFSLLGLLVLFLAVRAASGRRQNETKVTTDAVRRRTITETVSAGGKLYPENEIRIAPPATGEVTELNVQEGDRVVKGQVLARIQGDKGGGAAPRISIPNVPPGFENIVQGLQQPRTSSPSSAVIRAPMDGTVLGVSIKKGERVNAMSSDVMRIADMSGLEARINVKESDIIRVAVGDSADVEVEAYNGRRFKGVVTTITDGASRRDAQSLLAGDIAAYEVHVRLLPSSYNDLYDSTRKIIPFRSGMTARADIKTKRRENVLSVPVGAVVSRLKGSDITLDDSKKERAKDENTITDDNETSDALEEVVFVWKEGDTVAKRLVKTGIQDMNYFEILAGLQEGEKVVTGPYSAVSKTLRNGNRVAVVTKDKLGQTN